MKPDFREAAKKYAEEMDIPNPDGRDYNVCMLDFQCGANHGYSLAMEQHRDFYLLVREYFKHDHFRMHDEHEALYNKIQKHIAAFSEREQQSLPFKD
jgi:hypothetical protein